MINHYHIVLTLSGAVIVDWVNGRKWTCVGGYAGEGQVSQLDLDKIARWLGERSIYPGTLQAALEEAQ